MNEGTALTRQPHPRLLLTNERLITLKRQVQDDSFSQRLLAELQRRAERYLQQPLPEYRLEGRRLLGVSRRVLAHVMAFSLLGRLTGEARYVSAAKEEMLAAARFPDWNPSHFLDVAEMAMALAVGYDWLYDLLDSRDRATIEQALLDKALRPSFEKDWFWISGKNNWNPVCHAGLVFAALAIADLEPTLAKQVIDRAQTNVHRIADAYGPDGAYDEGPMYWDYGTSFLVLLCAAMESATGLPFDPGIPGLIPSADYMMHVVGPTGNFYNYSDCRLNRSPTAALFWFAQKLARPALTAIDRAALSESTDAAREGDRLLPMALVWHQPLFEADSERLPRFWIGTGQTPVALMRTRWNDPHASFLGIKAGSPSASHGHMDVGSFVFESSGVRWAIDLPMQDYHTLESAGVNLWDPSQSGDRWKVFRNGPEGHGILRFNDEPQVVHGMAVMQQVPEANAVGSVRIDLSPLYPNVVQSVTRRAALYEDGTAIIVDEWQTGSAEVSVSWQMLTTADVRMESDGILLQSNGKQLRIQFDAGDGEFSVSVKDVRELTKPYDAPNPNVSRLTVSLRTKPNANAKLTARFLPV